MHVINSLSDLKHFGFDLLTGEACNFGLRIVTDVTAQAKKIYCTVLGLPQNCELQEQWNRGDDKVGSVFLPKDMYGTLAIFALYSLPDVNIVIQGRHSYYGLSRNEEYEAHQKLYNAAMNFDYESVSALLYHGAAQEESIRIYKGIQPDNTVRNGSCISAFTGRSM